MRKRLIIIGITLALLAIGLGGCTQQNTAGFINTRQLLNQNFSVGDIINFEETINDVKIITTSYGEFTILLTPPVYIEGVTEGIHDTDRMGFYGEKNQHYTIGGKIQQELHIKEYTFNDHRLISPEEMYGYYLLLPTAIELAFDGASQYAGIKLNLKSIDNMGFTEYEIATDGFTYDPATLHLKLLKVSYDIGVLPVTNQKIGATSIALFAMEYLAITTSYTNFTVIDSMNSLSSGNSQNGFIQFIDTNTNNVLDDGDIITVHITPTPDKYTLESYLLTLGKTDVSSLNDVIAIKYMINWYRGVYSQEEMINS